MDTGNQRPLVQLYGTTTRLDRMNSYQNMVPITRRLHELLDAHTYSVYPKVRNALHSCIRLYLNESYVQNWGIIDFTDDLKPALGFQMIRRTKYELPGRSEEGFNPPKILWWHHFQQACYWNVRNHYIPETEIPDPSVILFEFLENNGTEWRWPPAWAADNGEYEVELEE